MHDRKRRRNEMASMAKGSKAKTKKVSRTSHSAAPRAAAGKPKRNSTSAAKRATGNRVAAKKTVRKMQDGKSARAVKSGAKSTQSRQRQTAPGKPIGVTARTAGVNKSVVGKSAAVAKPQPLSAEVRKKLAGEHLRELLEQKKLRAARTPAWQTIEHHDSALRPPEPMPHGAPSGSNLDRGLDEQDDADPSGSSQP
jgi:hypothetical protein